MKIFRCPLSTLTRGPLLALSTLLAAASHATTVQAVDSIAIPVTDLDRAVQFYTEVLEFRLIARHEAAGPGTERLLGVFGARVAAARLALGAENVELVEYRTPRGRTLPYDVRGNDLAFEHVALVVSDMTRAYDRLRAHHVSYGSTAPQTLPAWNLAAGGIAAFYFRDPDGNYLELLHFPPGKGRPQWQSATALFLGIDHTAITVADTSASLRYYRDLLGMNVVGESENYGTEQEHLNNVFGARLHITALRAARGPGVELLEYLAPRGGRPIPADTQGDDRWNWQIDFLSDSPEAALAAARAARTTLVSAEIAAPEEDLFGFQRGFVLRDPDGHAAAIGAAAASPTAAVGVRQ